MDYRLTPLTRHETGAEIRGLDLRAPVNADVREALNGEFARYHVLVFREQYLTAAQFARAGEIFGELMAHATHKRYEYRHQWRYGDLVIWDNRSVMHQANGDYDMNEVRHLHRIMIKGEPVIAAQLEAVAA